MLLRQASLLLFLSTLALLSFAVTPPSWIKDKLPYTGLVTAPISRALASVNCYRHTFPTLKQLTEAKAHLTTRQHGTVFYPTEPDDTATYGSHTYLKDVEGTLWHFEPNTIRSGEGCARKAFLLEKSRTSQGYPTPADTYIVKERRVERDDDELHGFRPEIRALAALGRLVGPGALVVGAEGRHRYALEPIGGIYQPGATVYFFQTLVPGTVLDACRFKIPSHQKMIVDHAVDALEAFHRLGFMLYDIGTDNLMVQPIRRLMKIIDFKVNLVGFENAIETDRDPHEPQAIPAMEVMALHRMLENYFGSSKECKGEQSFEFD